MAGCGLLIKELFTGLEKEAAGGVTSTRKLDDAWATFPALSATVTANWCVLSLKLAPEPKVPVAEDALAANVPVTSTPSSVMWTEVVSIPEPESEYCAKATGVAELTAPVGETIVNCGLMVSIKT